MHDECQNSKKGVHMKSSELLPELVTTPAVFAVKDHYQIMVPVKSDVLFWVSVNGKKYYDHSNGVLRSSTRIHKVSVPMTELDKAKEYTVYYRKIIDRKPYFPESEPETSATFSFKPISNYGKINIYHLSDTHGNFEKPALAGTYFNEDIDLLILNGDIPDHSGNTENFNLIFELCEAITKGCIPCMFSRGNHDTRGLYAEKIADYTPTENGHSYFSFRLGRIWGIVLDCGEDKDDCHAEYGNTVCCHEFREEQTEYLKNIISNAENEYNAKGVEYKLVIAHNPFSHTLSAPFDIETKIYKEWLMLLSDNIQPDIMLSGHLHTTQFSDIGGELDNLGQACTLVVSGKPVRDTDGTLKDYIGCAITFENKDIKISFTDSKKTIIQSKVVHIE